MNECTCPYPLLWSSDHRPTCQHYRAEIVPLTVVCWADQHDDCRGLRCRCDCHGGSVR